MAEMAQRFHRIKEVPFVAPVINLARRGRERFEEQVQKVKETPLFIKTESVTRPGMKRFDHMLTTIICSGAFIAQGAGLRATASGVASYVITEAGIKSKLKTAALVFIHPIC